MNASPRSFLIPGKRTNKYGAKRTELDGFTFDSRAEARRWSVLRLMERAGEISDLRRQVTFPLYVGDWLLAHYKADFVYVRAGKRVIEDVKSKPTITELFKLKAAIFRLQYGQDIEVVS
jgi:hypothetical protein